MAAEAFLTAIEVRDKAVQLVSAHAERLGMDPFAAAALVRAIHSIRVDDQQNPRGSEGEVKCRA